MQVNKTQSTYKPNPDFNRNTLPYTLPFNATLRQQWEAEAAGKIPTTGSLKPPSQQTQQDNLMLEIFKMQAAMAQMNSPSTRIKEYLNSYEYMEDMQPMILGNKSSSNDLYSTMMKMNGMGGMGMF